MRIQWVSRLFMLAVAALLLPSCGRHDSASSTDDITYESPTVYIAGNTHPLSSLHWPLCSPSFCYDFHATEYAFALCGTRERDRQFVCHAHTFKLLHDAPVWSTCFRNNIELVQDRLALQRHVEDPLAGLRFEMWFGKLQPNGIATGRHPGLHCRNDDV